MHCEDCKYNLTIVKFFEKLALSFRHSNCCFDHTAVYSVIIENLSLTYLFQKVFGSF